MKPSYIFRIDDICPQMNWDNFNKLRTIFERYDIKPIIGVIPDNKDKKLNIYNPNNNFWGIIKELNQKGWIIAQHGYQHLYTNNNSGILKINKKSEFAGLTYEEQLEKIKAGKEISESNLNTNIKWWMAPAHSFDENTCKALKKLGFEYITDGIALFPFEKYSLTWIPQQIWSPVKKMFGDWTICIHPNTINDEYLHNMEKFIVQNNEFCTNIDLNQRNYILNILFGRWWKFKYLSYKLIKTLWEKAI